MAVMRPTPDAAGFAEAQDAKRLQLGSDVTFRGPAVRTWPSGTPIDPNTGEPYDPTIAPVSVDQPSKVIRCGVFFKAVNRGGAANAAVGSPAGWDERTRIFAIGPWSERAFLRAAVEMVFHDDVFQVDVVKDDEIILGYRRVLVYAAAE